MNEELRENYQSLTPRETKVVFMILDGMTHKEIALHFSISTWRVSHIKNKAMKKLLYNIEREDKDYEQID